MHERIPFLPLPVEYVANEYVQSNAARAVEAELRNVISAEHKKIAVSNGTHALGVDESEVYEEEDSLHNSRGLYNEQL